MSDAIVSTIRVSEVMKGSKDADRAEPKEVPNHWVDATGTAFRNPWPSWRSHAVWENFTLAFEVAGRQPTIPKNISDLIPVRTPTWGFEDKANKDKIRATWLGHACFLVEFPVTARAGMQPNSRGARVLFDPVFSERCSPMQWIGPKRYTPPPCDIKEIPELDIIVISHNHYDHLDTHTILELSKRTRVPHIFAPLGNQDYFKSLGVPENHIHVMDWWDSKRVHIDVTSDNDPNVFNTVTIDVTCTPAQHFTGRGILDRFKTLWASWVVETVDTSNPMSDEHQTPGTKVFFAGDTGYRALLDGQDINKAPVCPVFKEIGERFGGFDFAMIPIGAYLPQKFMSPIHCSPMDSVSIFKDVRAKRAIGMHWGTWILTTEDVLEPPKGLAEECRKAGIADDLFTICGIGETVVI